MPGEKDEKKWDRAKEIVHEQYPNRTEDDDSFWALTQHIYQNMEKSSQMDKYNTRNAFINGVLYKVNLLQSGLSQVIDKLSKIDARADEMVSHLDALSADQHSSQLTTVCKKIQKALDACNYAKEAVDSMMEDISDNIVVEEKEDVQEEETQEQQQESSTSESEESETSTKEDKEEVNSDELLIEDEENDSDSDGDSDGDSD